jgi:hypothetical protein
MKKIILSLTILGFASPAMRLHAMGQNQSQTSWIKPAIAGATALGGLFTARFFWYRNRILKPPTQPQKPAQDPQLAGVKTKLEKVQDNIHCLNQIKFLGGYQTESQVQDLKKEIRKLKLSTIQYNLDTWLNYNNVGSFLAQAFSANKHQRNEMLDTRDYHTEFAIARCQAVQIANKVDETLQNQMNEKAELETQEKDLMDREVTEGRQHYYKQQTYDKENSTYHALRARNKKFMGLSLGVTGLSTAALFYFSKKK